MEEQDPTMAQANKRQSDAECATTPVDCNGSLTRYIQRILLLMLMVAIATCAVIALRLLCVLFAGLLFGVFLHRISSAIEDRTPMPYRVALGIVIVSLLGLVVGMGVLVAPRLGSQLPDLSNQLTDSVKELLAQVRASGWLDNITEEAPQISGRLLGNLDAGAILGGAFSSISAAVTAVFLVLFVGVFLAFDPGLYYRGFLLLVPPVRRPRADEVLRASLDTLWWWTLGRLFAMTVVGIATGIGLWLLGVPMAFMLGAIAGLISFVPTIGAVLAILPALLLAVQQGWSTVLYVLVLYGCVQALENNVLTPLVQQKAVSVPPVILIVAQVLMGILVGIMGVVIATPLAALVIELVRELYVKNGLERPSHHPASDARSDIATAS